jgi:flagellum-specific peptidoglycan hydrolase FlgJ
MKKSFTFLLIGASLSVSGQNSASRYIEKYRDVAIEKMNQHGVPASVILGVSMHESGNGTSKIARYLNNHFGIKGKNTSKEIQSAYRGYESVLDSYSDFIAAMSRNKKFKALFGKYTHYDYRNWVLGIQSGGYASSHLWGSRVLAIIVKYQLYQYDNRPEDYTEPTEYTKPVSQAKVTETVKSYLVKKGDTLSEIAQRFGTSTKSIMTKNLLNTTRLSIGQSLKL